jgi:uncharacterized protein with FMN-binding domain
MKSRRLPLLFIASVVFLTTSPSPASFIVPPRDGKFTGSTIGYSGEVVVTLTFSNGRIEDVKIGHEESMDLGACEVLARRIVDLQTPNVDAISGATVTSEAVVEAAFTAYENATRSTVDEPEGGLGLPTHPFSPLPEEPEISPILLEERGPQFEKNAPLSLLEWMSERATRRDRDWKPSTIYERRFRSNLRIDLLYNYHD